MLRSKKRKMSLSVTVARLYLEDEEVFGVDVDTQLLQLFQVDGWADNLNGKSLLEILKGHLLSTSFLFYNKK